MNVQSGKNHIFMNVQSGENYIFMNVLLGENHIFMNESGVQGALHGVSTDELSHFNGEKCTARCLQRVSTDVLYILYNQEKPCPSILTPCKQGAVHFLGVSTPKPTKKSVKKRSTFR